MDFKLSSEQVLLRDSARRYLQADGDAGSRHQQGAASVRDRWARFADMGWLSMLAPEDAGGLASSLEDIAILSEEMGRSLCREGFIGGAVLPIKIIDRCGSSRLRLPLLTAITDNSARFAVALYEPGRCFELSPAACAMAMPDGSYRLSGSKCLVAGGAGADRLIVSARIEKGLSSESRVALFVVDAGRSGVQKRVYPTVDDVEVADFGFEAVFIDGSDVLVVGDTALEIVEDAIDEALVCLCAEMLGGMDRAIELTSEYLKVRKQFGRALGEFQALQHTAAEMWIEANNARSMVYSAIAALAMPRPKRRRAVSACSIKVLQTAKSVFGTAVHLHGGIGVTC
jgi:acyl-CoA dehydrogenase